VKLLAKSFSQSLIKKFLCFRIKEQESPSYRNHDRESRIHAHAWCEVRDASAGLRFRDLLKKLRQLCGAEELSSGNILLAYVKTQ
jgi:hypothetical protein